jgi:hypothetical protein
MWYLYTVEFCSATKKNEILSFIEKWMELKNIIFREVSQTRKPKSHVSPHGEYRPNTNTSNIMKNWSC